MHAQESQWQWDLREVLSYKSQLSLILGLSVECNSAESLVHWDAFEPKCKSRSLYVKSSNFMDQFLNDENVSNSIQGAR